MSNRGLIFLSLRSAQDSKLCWLESDQFSFWMCKLILKWLLFSWSNFPYQVQFLLGSYSKRHSNQSNRLKNPPSPLWSLHWLSFLIKQYTEDFLALDLFLKDWISAQIKDYFTNLRIHPSFLLLSNDRILFMNIWESQDSSWIRC